MKIADQKLRILSALAVLTLTIGASPAPAQLPIFTTVYSFPTTGVTGGGSQSGDPAKAAQAILTAVNSDAPPLRLVLGADALDGIDDRLHRIDKELRAWDAIGRATAFDD
jgi:hypothetical protein